MQNRAVLPSPIVKTRKISSPVKPAKLGANVGCSTKSEGFHNKCFTSPQSPEKSRQTTLKLTTPSTLSATSKKPLASRNVPSPPPPGAQQTAPTLPSHPGAALPGEALKPTRPPSTAGQTSRPGSGKSSTSSRVNKQTVEKKPIQPTNRNLTEPLPPRPRGFQQLAAKFSEIASTTLQIASSKRPLSTRSFEALLSRELSDHLGDDVNNPGLSHGFVQATRELLKNLVDLYEEGKLNPKLLGDRSREDQSYIKANSSTSVCYRDRYFKELVLNVLQSMTSSEIEEEVTVQATHSEESKERLRVIRDMVMLEAGLEPENLRKMEKELEEMMNTLTINKQEVKKAALEVDRIISQHTIEQDTLSSLKIPKAARAVLRASCGYRLESGSDNGKCDKDGCGTKSGCCENTLYSKDVPMDPSEKYRKSLSIFGGNEFFEKGNSDEIRNIRPQLKLLVHEELLKIKMKEEEILNRDREFDRANGLLMDTPKSSSESVEFKSAMSNISADDEDEITEEETLIFLEALKADIKERKIKHEDILLNHEPKGCGIQVLEKIEEDINEINHEEKLEKSGGFKAPEGTHYSASVIDSSINLTPVVCCDETLGIRPQIISNVRKLPSVINMIERVKSKWIIKEESEVSDVIAELKEAFDMFKESQCFSDLKMSEYHEKETGYTSEAEKSNAEEEYHIWYFTVGEVAHVLTNICVKINNLPEYLQEITSNDITPEKEQVYNVLNVLEKYMNASKPEKSNVTVDLNEASVLFPIKRLAETFSFMSNTLSCCPNKMKSESISLLDPPTSLIETLEALRSTQYFRDCFTSVKENLDNQLDFTKEIHGKPYIINKQLSVKELDPKNNSSLEKSSSRCEMKIHAYARDVKRSNDWNKNLDKFEHFMGLTASVMTVQNVSDMFLFLSVILNDVPERLKSENILDLDPPPSLLKALDILYCTDGDDSIENLSKRKSLTSLTVQSVSDLLLTLSKTFDNIPEGLKETKVGELKPPRSLMRAITLLTSLSHFSIPENNNNQVKGESYNDSHDQFFDAVTSLSSMI